MHVMVFKFITLLLLSVSLYECHGKLCKENEKKQFCSSPKQNYRYLFYDVNPPEGFNLRRDVYMRIVHLTQQLSKIGPWKLVLPPWPHLIHWRSPISQDRLPWSTFFDVASLAKFAPVVEHLDVVDDLKKIVIDQVFVLQHYKDMFSSGAFIEKFEISPCNDDTTHRKYYRTDDNASFEGYFWGMDGIKAKKVDCLSFHGSTTSLTKFLNNSKMSLIMLDHAEVPLHTNFGGVDYWRARRSMRFAKHLVKAAAEFRLKKLNSWDESDGTVQIEDWTKEILKKDVKGGPFLGAHLRRADFVKHRVYTVPTILGAAKQIGNLLEKLDLDDVFVATDATKNERSQLKNELKKLGFNVKYFSYSDNKIFLDGEIAIIEQIICSHARYFIGSYESTYSFRIQEEREIMGFAPETTFNRFCGDNESKSDGARDSPCQQLSQWRIKWY